MDWQQEKTKARVEQFMNILEQIPRLCSPTICGTLSQPTTRTERLSRGGDVFEWSLEQKAILSPANITTDADANSDWHNVSELNPVWRQQESDRFFSQRTIAPSPMVTPSVRNLRRPAKSSDNQFRSCMYDEEDEDDIEEEADEDLEQSDCDFDVEPQQQQDLKQQQLDETQNDDRDFDDDYYNSTAGARLEITNGDIDNSDSGRPCSDDMQDMDNMFLSPILSQSQQRMGIFSPSRSTSVMDDESTIQSTPKTTGSQQRTRTRTRQDIDMLD